MRFSLAHRAPNIQLRQLLTIVGGLMLLVATVGAGAESITITYRSPESINDRRYDYDLALLRLALDKTTDEYGGYHLIPSGEMNFSRAVKSVEENSRTNFFIKLSYDKTFNKSMDYVPFPIDLGIVGKRVCFISPKTKLALTDNLSLGQLKKLTHAQGRGWLDVDILRQNGFTVFEANSYESLFLMVAKGRVDLFCRGVNELLLEYEKYKHILGLSYDETFVLTYDLPRFFYTNKANKQALERVRKGVLLAYQDGSLTRLWHDHYQPSVDFAQLTKRQHYLLNNPKVADLALDYQQYFIKITPPNQGSSP